MRVLIGSTQKMGTGTNVQKRLVALHHLDAPWKPAEVEQRDGRILRQKNENKQVAIYRYVTTGSFDSYMWQALETKARFISQVMTGDNALRRAEDIGGQELSYAEVKAIASGNPAVLTLAEADAELQRLNLLKRNHADEQYLARRRLRELPETIDQLSQRLSNLTADMETVEGPRRRPLSSAAAPLTAETRSTSSALAWTPCRNTSARAAASLWASYRGLHFGVMLDPQYAPEVYLEGAITRRSPLSREHHGPRAVLNALERLAGGYGSECSRVQENLGIAESQLRDYKARLGAPFPHDAYLAELTGLRDQLKAGLSGATAGAGAPKRRRRVAELAERIKTLKAAHTIEATPQRTGKRRSSAEEPVTARIRRRIEANPAAASETEAEAAAAPSAATEPAKSEALAALENLPPLGTPSYDPNAAQHWSVQPEKTSQERAARGR